MSDKVLATPKFENEIKRLSSKFPSIKTDYTGFLFDIEINPLRTLTKVFEVICQR